MYPVKLSVTITDHVAMKKYVYENGVLIQVIDMNTPGTW